MTIPLFEITQFSGENWKDFLTKICLYEVFKDLVEEYHADNKTLSSYIRYILWAYSASSPKIIHGMDWHENKKEIFKQSDVTETKENKEALGIDGVYSNVTVIKTINKWRDWQNGEVFNTLSMLNDLILEFRIAANMPVKKSSAEIDYKIKKECAMSVIDFLQKKKELENNFIQNTPLLKEAYAEVSEAFSKMQPTTMGLESMLKGSL